MLQVLAALRNFSCQQPFQISQAKTIPPTSWKSCRPTLATAPGRRWAGATASGSTFNNGVYCISDLDAYDQKDIILNNATLYVTITIQLKVCRWWSVFLQTQRAVETLLFMNYYMVIAYYPTPCPGFNDNNSQVIQYRGQRPGYFFGDDPGTFCLLIFGVTVIMVPHYRHVLSRPEQLRPAKFFEFRHTTDRRRPPPCSR